jgi:hypothetical protein
MIWICACVAVALVGLYFAFRSRRDPFTARGATLDRLAAVYGIDRRRWESDKKLRARCLDVHRGIKMTGRDADGRGPQ